jgi:hypothetical protein
MVERLQATISRAADGAIGKMLVKSARGQQAAGIPLSNKHVEERSPIPVRHEA